MDGAMIKSPLGGEKKPVKTRPIAEKLGVKRSVLTDGRGVPLAVDISGANTHDIKLLKSTFDNMPVRSSTTDVSQKKQHVCLDKSYDSADTIKLLKRRHYIPHVKSRGQEEVERKKQPRLSRPPLGRRTNPLLDQPLSVDFSPVGKRKPTTTSPSSISPSPGSS